MKNQKLVANMYACVRSWLALCLRKSTYQRAIPETTLIVDANKSNY